MLRRLLLVLCLLSLSTSAGARTSEISLSLDLPSDLLPTLVCVQAPKVSKVLLESAQDFGAFSVQPKALNQGVAVTHFSPTCETNQGACDSCAIPKGQPGGVVCIATESYDGVPMFSGAERDLQISLENAGIVSMQMHGQDIVLKVEVAEGAPVRVTPIGGGYQRGLARTVPPNDSLALPLRNRCLLKTVRYPLGAAFDPQQKPELRESQGKEPVALWAEQRTGDGVEALIVVPESGQVAELELFDGAADYVGTFSYPMDGPIELRAKKFSFNWQKSAFVTGRRAGLEALWSGDPARDNNRSQAHTDECPDVSLPRVAKASCKVKATPDDAQCVYECESPQPVEFPSTVEFRLKPPALLVPSDLIVWQDEVKYPDDRLSSFQKLEDRRIYLIWPKEKQDALGREWEAIELVGADGKIHRPAPGTSSISVPGVGTPANFSYQYIGRGPHKSKTLTAEGDLLRLSEPSESRQSGTLSFQGHVGLLLRTNAGPGHVASPLADLALTARFGVHWEGSLIGAFTLNPSSVHNVDDQSERWITSDQIRIVLLAGYRTQVNSVNYFTFGVGGGATTNALASDWSKSKPFPVALAQVRYGYELSGSIAFEPFVEFWAPERYVQNSQDLAGPRAPTSRYGVSFVGGFGIQWQDAL